MKMPNFVLMYIGEWKEDMPLPLRSYKWTIEKGYLCWHYAPRGIVKIPPLDENRNFVMSNGLMYTLADKFSHYICNDFGIDKTQYQQSIMKRILSRIRNRKIDIDIVKRPDMR